MTTGSGQLINIRPKNSCAANLANTQTLVPIVINRVGPNFTISASPASVACGASTPVTFTVNNSGTTTGITGYAWNLGSADNGWLYGGRIAPATINTATNTLTLVPDCGRAPSSPSVTVTVAGSCNVNVPKGSFNITAPALSINGPSTICGTSANYNITGLPCNAANVWSILQGNGIASLTQDFGTTTTLTKLADGDIKLNSAVSACNTTYNTSIPVHAGAYNAGNYNITSSNGSVPNYCLSQNMTFTLAGGAVGNNYNWTYPSGWSLVYNAGNSIILKTPSSNYPPTGSVAVTFNEACGNQVNKSFFVAYSSSFCGVSSSPYTISPNPAYSNITIACASLQSYCNIAAVQITDSYGTVKSSQSWPYTNQQVQMPVGFLPNGTYIAKIYSGTQWYSNQFVVSH